MRDAPYISSLWQQGGPFTGAEGKPHTRVYVQDPWDTDDIYVKDGDEDHVIHPTSSAGVGNHISRGVPIRWFQKADSSQNMREVPNLLTVDIDRSVDNDVATCNIVLNNQWMYANGAAPEGGGNRELRGFFTPNRGVEPSAQARWGHETNEWEGVFTPNTILRTYQGFGGHAKSLEDALTDGNLLLTGVWLIDTVNLSTDGKLNIDCRDMGKLLVEQQLYPPLIPAKKYPLTYYRYVYDNFRIRAAARTSVSSTKVNVTKGDKRCRFVGSEVDRWYPQASPGSQIASGGFTLHGHRGAHSIDGNNNSYYLGVGNAGPDRPFSVMYIEYSCGEYINAVYMRPWAGNYTMYISVYENGAWQGANTIPYSEAELIGNQPYVVDTGADIRYVTKAGVPWETGREYKLPRYYKADRVRITFRHLAYSGIGPWMYRGGVREVRLRSTTSTSITTGTTTRTVQPWFWAAAGLRDPTDLNRVGYVTASQMGQVDAFGDCRVYARSGGDAPSSADVFWIALTSSGNGYWMLHKDGTVTSYGGAAFYGSPKADGVGSSGGGSIRGGYWQAIVPTPTNLGYFCVAVDGRIRAYGDAVDAGYPSTVPGFTFVQDTNWISGAYGVPGEVGMLVCAAAGGVYALGTATHFGNWDETSLSTTTRRLASAVPTMDGTGYWLMTTDGRVDNKGSAVDYGQVAVPSSSLDQTYDQLIPIPTDDGYLLLNCVGPIYPFGNAQYFGSPVPGETGQIRRDGNYKDYADIIRDLALWSGFLLFDEDTSSNAIPPVYGNIETTGAFSPEPLPDELFDKKPVIDAMTELKETVGYLLFVDDEGGFRFESPNFWSYGNFVQGTGERIYEIPEIDERVNLFSYAASRTDDSLRSLIIISSEDPNEAGDSTITTKIVPHTAAGLKGLLKPAMWVNGWFQDPEEQSIMAELISLHIWFAQRLGQVECVANPAIQINDQVRIFEQTTSEVYLHYVRGVHTTHDLESGDYSMTLTTHWLGTGEDWAITNDPAYIEDDNHFVASPSLIQFLEHQGNNEFRLGFPTDDPAFKAIDPMGPTGDPAAGSGPSA